MVSVLPYDFNIVPVSIGNCEFNYIKSFTYDGITKNCNLTVLYNGSQLIENKDYAVIRNNNTNAGTASETVIGVNYFTGEETI